MDRHEKRKFPRFPVTELVICSRYGRQMSMRTQNISLGGLKVEANFNLGVGESLDLAIITNDIRIQCKGIILAIEEFNHKILARLRFARISHVDSKKLSDYLDTLSRGGEIPVRKWLIVGLFILMMFIAYLLMRTYF